MIISLGLKEFTHTYTATTTHTHTHNIHSFIHLASLRLTHTNLTRYIDTAVRSGMTNKAKFEVCDSSDDTCTTIVNDLSTATACNADTGFCSLDWTLAPSLTTSNPVYLKATSISMPTCYTPAVSSNFEISSPLLPVQVVAPNAEGCGNALTEWHAGCIETNAVTLTTLDRSANVEIEVCKNSTGVCENVGLIMDWDDFDVGNANFSVPSSLVNANDYKLKLTADCFSQIESSEFPIVTFTNNEVVLSVEDTAPASYQSADTDWMENDVNTVTMNFTAPVAHIPVELWVCPDVCTNCEAGEVGTSWQKVGGQYVSTSVASVSVDIQMVQLAGASGDDYCILPVLQGQQRSSCAAFSGVQVKLHAWNSNTISHTPAQDSTFDPACGVCNFHSLTHLLIYSHTHTHNSDNRERTSTMDTC